MLEQNLPTHKGSLHITHNEHTTNYETVAEYITRDMEYYFSSPEDRQKCIDTNTIWELQWYPDTPVGFYHRAASTLEGLLAPEFEED